jgi:hypothetical protein
MLADGSLPSAGPSSAAASAARRSALPVAAERLRLRVEQRLQRVEMTGHPLPRGRAVLGQHGHHLVHLAPPRQPHGEPPQVVVRGAGHKVMVSPVGAARSGTVQSAGLASVLCPAPPCRSRRRRAGHPAALRGPGPGRSAPPARPARPGRDGHRLPRCLAGRAGRGGQGAAGQPAGRPGRRGRPTALPARAGGAPPGARAAPGRGAGRRRRRGPALPGHPLRPRPAARRPGRRVRAAGGRRPCGCSPAAWRTPSPRCTGRAWCTAT